ncbi:hypothetical protein [Devosia sp.]|uniref:hypothetical protein n=1 Tax=Devosia sp. TaxID=1871048 RepID=UPI002733CF6B|nr:hypothetical protein [Devosia sp.]MDP2779755.1 hypothetical protein [Devosia sp.]
MDKAARDILVRRYAQRASRAADTDIDTDTALLAHQVRESYRDIRLLANEVEYLQQQITKQDGYLRGLLDQLTLDVFLSLFYARGLPLTRKLYGIASSARAALGMAGYPAEYITRITRSYPPMDQEAAPEEVAP